MIVKDSKGREAEISIGGSASDDIEITDASYTDDGSAVPDDEIEHILDAYAGEISQEWHENMVCAAEDAYDRAMDR